MTHDRRKLLKYMAGTSAAGLLAGCGGDGNGSGNGGNGNGNGNGGNGTGGSDDTVTTLSGDEDGNGNGEETTEESDCERVNLTPEGSGGNALFWHARTDAETSLLEDTVAIFNNDFDQSVSLTKIPSNNFQAKLQTEIPAGNGPHIFEWAHDLAGSWDQSGYLSDQSDNVRVDSCQFTETAWNATQYNGQTIGLPFAAETVTMIYNKDIVDSPPETLEDMTSIMEDFHDPGNNQYGLGYPINPYYVSAFAQAYGEPIYDGQADELGVARDEVAKGLRVILEDLKPYMPSDPGAGPQQSVFRDGDAAFTINGPWELGNIREAGVDYGITPLPALPEGGTPRPYMGVKLLYFATKMDDEETNGQAAREYAEWFTTKDTRLLNLANQAGFVPVRVGLAGNPNLPSDVKGYAEQVETGFPMPANPKMNQVWGPFGDAVQNAFNNPGQLEEGLEAAANEIRSNWEG